MFTCSAHPKKNPFGREEVFRFGFLTAKRLGLAVALLAAITPASAWAQTVYTWNGSVSSDFSNSGNWSGGDVPTTNNYPTALNARITVASGNNYPLIYTSAQGHTLYAASGDPTYGRSLFIFSGGMIIQGGTFESQATSADGIVNGTGSGYLTINGGAYINTEGTGARTFLVIHGGGGSGTLTIQSGTFAVHTLKFGDSSTSTGTGYVYLNGGLLSVGTIVDSGNAVSYVYLNGGTLQARAETTTFLNNLDNVYVSTGGAIIDTQSYSVTIPVVLKHDPAGSSPDGGLTKKGAGGLILSAANTYTGTTTVETGILKISHSQALGATDGGTVVNQGAQLALSGGITVTGEALTLYGQGPGNVHGLFAAGGGTNTWDGPITLAAANVRIGAGSGQTLVISGVINDGGNGYDLIIRNTGGETILKGANTYTGPTRVFVGTVKIDGGDNRLPTGSVLQIGNTSNVDWATFDLNGYNQQVAGLVSEGTTMTMTVTNSSATAATLTINNSTDRTYGGVITGNLSLVKQGTPTQTLSGSSANTYTGTTTVQDGRLHLSKSSSVNAIGGDLVISGGGVTFGASDQLPNTATVTMSGGTLNGTAADTNRRDNHTETIASLTMTGGVFQSGITSNWTISGDGAITGGTGARVIFNSGAQISFNSLSLTNMTAATPGPNNFILYGNRADARTTLTIGSGGLTLNNSMLNLRRGSVENAQGSRVVLNGNVTTTGSAASYIREDASTGETIGELAVELSGTSGTVTRTFNIGGGGADLTISIPITNGAADTAGITKTGAGTLTLSGSIANTYTGTTTVQEGRLHLSKSSGVNAIGGDLVISGGQVTFGNNHQIPDTAAVTMSSGVFNGTGPNVGQRTNHTETLGSLAVTGGAFNAGSECTWTITGSGSFTGGAGNTMFIGNSGAVLSFGSLSVKDMTATAGGNPATANSFTLYGASTNRQSTITVGSGGLTLDNAVLNLRRGGSGTNGSRLVLDGDVTTTGTSPSSIKEDTAGGTTGAIAVELSSTSGTVTRTFHIGGGGADLTISIPITNGAADTAGITKTGAGTLILSGANTYTGLTLINEGTVRLGSGSALGASGTADNGTQIAAGGTLDLNGQNAQNERISVAGTITNTGADQTNALRYVTLSGNATFTGTARWDIRGTNGNLDGQLVLAGFTATKSGTNTLGIIDTTITGPGGITINEGTVILARSSWTNGALTANSGTTVWFSYNTGSYSYQMNMVVNGATIRSDGAANSVESPIALTGSNTIQVDNNSLTLTGVISGTGSITKTAGGTLILSGANTYTGQTTVSQGVLRITHGSALGAGDATAATGTTVSSGARLELTDGITVANEALQLAGDGGGQGALRNASGTNTWAGPISLTAGSRIDIVGGSTLTISGNVSLGSNSLVVRGGGNATISGQLSGSGNLTLTDGGVLTLGNANNINTFSGKIMASYGVISVADVAALGSHSQLRLGQGTYSVDTGTLRYTGTTNATIDKEIRLFSDATYGKARLEVTNTAATLTFTGNFQYESGATTGGQWILAGAGSGVIYGNITTTDASLSKVDSGTWTLAGNNSYKGTTTVSAGVLRLSSPTALGTTDGGTTVSSGARLELAGGITVTGEALSIAGLGGNNIGALQSASGDNTWAGPITLAANDTRIGANGAGQVLRVTGAIGDGGSGYNLAVRNEVGGETILSGQNTYGGATSVVVGVLKIDGGNDRLPTGSPLQIGNSNNVAWARFDLNGYNQQVAGLVSEGTTMGMTVTNSSATAATLTINNSTDQTYGGVITGNLSLVKQGPATQTLSGANTYTGTTDVQGGTLALAHTSNNNISGSSAIRVGAGATLNVTGLASSLLRLASGQTLQGNGTVQGSVEAPAGSFLGAGMSPGHLTISGNYTQAGTLVVELAGYQQGGTQAVPGQWAANGYDWVSVGGQAVLDGYVDIRLLAGFQPQSGDKFNVLTAAGGITDQGLELLWEAGSLLPAQYWTYQIVAGQGNERILQLQLGVPEPASLVLLVLGAAGLLLARSFLARKRQ